MSITRGSLASEERLRWLSDRLLADGAVRLTEAADALGVSEMTIRRDLAELEQRGTARRVRGGATAVGPQPFAERHRIATRAKARIAAKLSAFVPSDGIIALDASSTMLRLVPNLGPAKALTVLTNSPETFATLQGRVGVTPLLTGGELDPRTGSLVGPLACATAELANVAVLFASAAGVHPAAGTTEPTFEEAQVKRSIAAWAGQVVVAADASKFGVHDVAACLGWDRVDALVTDLDPADVRLAPYRDVVDVR